MLGAKLGNRLDTPLTWLLCKIKGENLNPTALTLLGLFFNIIATVLIIIDYWRIAAFVILFAGFFDMLDGVVARNFGKVSKFGGFIDSVIDRYSDLSLLIGIIIFYTHSSNKFLVFLTSIVLLGTFLIPYTRAKAETFLSKCNVGIMERAERIILLTVGCFFRIMPLILWIMAILTHLTVLQRIYYTWKESQKLQRQNFTS